MADRSKNNKKETISGQLKRGTSRLGEVECKKGRPDRGIRLTRVATFQ